MEVRLLSKQLTSLVCVLGTEESFYRIRRTPSYYRIRRQLNPVLFSHLQMTFSLPSSLPVWWPPPWLDLPRRSLDSVQQRSSDLCHSLGTYAWLMALFPSLCLASRVPFATQALLCSTSSSHSSTRDVFKGRLVISHSVPREIMEAA